MKIVCATVRNQLRIENLELIIMITIVDNSRDMTTES